MRSATVLGALALVAACSAETGAPPATAEAAPPVELPPPLPGTPDDVVLRVDSVEIRRAEVDALAADVALLFPTFAESHWRSQALTYLILPRAALAARHAEARAAAYERARAALARLRAGEEVEGVRQVDGGWKPLTLELWSAARALEPGRWSEPVESLGQVGIVRLVARGEPAATEREEQLLVDVAVFPFLPEGTTREDVDATIDSARLEIVDPGYEFLVPESWKHRMRGDRS